MGQEEGELQGVGKLQGVALRVSLWQGVALPPEGLLLGRLLALLQAEMEGKARGLRVLLLQAVGVREVEGQALGQRVLERVKRGRRMQRAWERECNWGTGRPLRRGRALRCWRGTGGATGCQWGWGSRWQWRRCWQIGGRGAVSVAGAGRRRGKDCLRHTHISVRVGVRRDILLAAGRGVRELLSGAERTWSALDW